MGVPINRQRRTARAPTDRRGQRTRGHRSANSHATTVRPAARPPLPLCSRRKDRVATNPTAASASTRHAYASDAAQPFAERPSGSRCRRVDGPDAVRSANLAQRKSGPEGSCQGRGKLAAAPRWRSGMRSRCRSGRHAGRHAAGCACVGGVVPVAAKSRRPRLHHGSARADVGAFVSYKARDRSPTRRRLSVRQRGSVRTAWRSRP